MPMDHEGERARQKQRRQVRGGVVESIEERAHSGAYCSVR
jgi:hypothetical protein